MYEIKLLEKLLSSNVILVIWTASFTRWKFKASDIPFHSRMVAYQTGSLVSRLIPFLHQI